MSGEVSADAAAAAILQAGAMESRASKPQDGQPESAVVQKSDEARADAILGGDPASPDKTS